MPCKSCRSNEVADGYECPRCLVRRKSFLWCVITDVPHDGDGNMADDLLIYDRKSVWDVISNGHSELWSLKRELFRRFTKVSRNVYHMQVKRQVFTVGEMFMVNPDFERELTGARRAPHKWMVNYELFPAAKFEDAVKRSWAASEKWEEVEHKLFTERHQK